MFFHLYVLLSPSCAVHNHTGDAPSRASSDASCTLPHTVWLSAGVPHHTAVCCGRNPTEIANFLWCSRSSVFRYIRLQRSRLLSNTSLLRNKPRSLRECTNLMWACGLI